MSQIKIFANSRQAMLKKPTGKGVYAKNILKLLEQKPDLKLTMLASKPWLKFGLWHFYALYKVIKHKPDIYFDPESYITPFIISLFTKTQVIVTVHDLVAFKFAKGHFLKSIIIERLFLPLLVKLKTVQFFCISEFSKQQFIEHFSIDSKRVHLTPLGFNMPQLKQQTKVPSSESKPLIIVCISTFLERKNQLNLVYEFSLIKDRIKHNLYLVGGGDSRYVRKVQDLILKLGLENRVFITGYVCEQEKLRLLLQAEFTVYPSLYEGFGLPLLESLAFKKPVITTKSTVMQEVLGEAGLYYDPRKTTDLAFQMSFLANNKEFQQQLLEHSKTVLKKYSWQKTANQAYKVFKSLA